MNNPHAPPPGSGGHSSPIGQGHSAEPGRRSALLGISAILGTLATLAAGVPILGFLISPFLRKVEDQWIDMGAIGDFPIGQTRMTTFDNPLRQPWDGYCASTAAYVRRIEEEKFLVLSVNCTHLGCPVTWFPASGLFLCPCHGGVYYEDGSHASGPPPRGLYHLPSRVEKGRLMVLVGHMPTLQEV